MPKQRLAARRSLRPCTGSAPSPPSTVPACFGSGSNRRRHFGVKQVVEWGFTRAGFERETRTFHPHLTLGRVGRENGAETFHSLHEMLAELPYVGSMAVTDVTLMRSQLSRGGVRYTVISRYPLAEADRTPLTADRL